MDSLYRKVKVKFAIAGLALLFCVHFGLSYLYTGSMLENVRNDRYRYVDLYVFTTDAYKLLSLGERDFASRLLLLYVFYSQANINIPSIDFNRLTTALYSVKALDPDNDQPYLHIAYYWIWAKKDESRRYMADFMLTGIDRFIDSWDMAYAVYRLLTGLDDKTAMYYLKVAAERAAEHDGPNWIVDLPAILMSRKGETIEAILWLEETLFKTENVKQQQIILDKIEE
ncbi:MAG: hypothetical protein LBP51_05920, partial [Deferribacteraceae bacterium]|nr:hypothetical protein [Deferribacteraceae bacterium]